MEGDRIMLVYEHKTSGGKLVPDGVALMDETDLVKAMSKGESVLCVKFSQVFLLTWSYKSLKPGQRHIDIYKSDLVQDRNQKTGLADGEEKREEIPWRVWLGYEWEGHSFTELTILTAAPQHTVSQSESAQ